jgi:hypothetical protein
MLEDLASLLELKDSYRPTKFVAANDKIIMKLLRETENSLRFGILATEISLTDGRHEIRDSTCARLAR